MPLPEIWKIGPAFPGVSRVVPTCSREGRLGTRGPGRVEDVKVAHGVAVVLPLLV